MEDIRAFLRAIPEAAASPYAFMAYGLAAILSVLSVFQRKHVKDVLKVIRNLPEAERKEAIELALNTKLPKKISAEQYLRGEKTKYLFFGTMAFLVLVGALATIAILKIPAPSVAKKSALRVQLWPRPEIKDKFLKDHDAHLYVKTDNEQIDLTTFVPMADFLDETTDVDEKLIGKPVDFTIAPREKYLIVQDRRFLTHLVRLEVYPIGKKAIPQISEIVKPDGQKFLATSHLPITGGTVVLNANLVQNVTNNTTEVVAGRPYLLQVHGSNLSADAKLDIIDEKGEPVSGAWIGNELGTANGKPVEVGTDGKSLKAYFAVPWGASGQKLYWRIQEPNRKSSELALEIVNRSLQKEIESPKPEQQ